MKNIITEDDRNVDSHKQKRARHAQNNHCTDIKNLIEDTEWNKKKIEEEFAEIDEMNKKSEKKTRKKRVCSIS